MAFARERGCGPGLVGPAQKRAPSTRPPARRTAATGPKTNGEQKMSCGAGNISVRAKCKALFERFRNAANTEKAAPPEGPDRPAAFGPLRQAGPGCALPPKACGAKGPFLIPGCKQQKRKRFGGAPGSLRDALGLVVVAFCWARARAGWERAHEGPPTRNPVSFAFFSATFRVRYLLFYKQAGSRQRDHTIPPPPTSHHQPPPATTSHHHPLRYARPKTKILTEKTCTDLFLQTSRDVDVARKMLCTPIFGQYRQMIVLELTSFQRH